MKKIGATLRKLRLEQNLTQAELAKAVGINRSMVTRIEGGENINPTFNVLKKLSMALGASVVIFFNDQKNAND